MTDLSKLSDADLKALYAQEQSNAPDLSAMSDSELKTLYLKETGGGKKLEKPPGPSKAESGMRGVADAALLGASDEANAAAQASPMPFGEGRRNFKPIMANPVDVIAGGLRMGAEKLLPSVFGSKGGEQYDVALPQERASQQAAQQENPGSYFAGQLAGGLATAPVIPAVGAGAASMAGRIGGGLLSGAGVGGLYGFNSGEGGLESRLGEAGKGAAFGGALGAAFPVAQAGLRRAVSPATIAPERQALIDTLDKEGVTALTAGQKTGSKPMKWLESTLGDMPGAGGQVAKVTDLQGQQFTGAVMKRLGSDAKLATPEAVNDAVTAMEDKFKTLAGRNTLKVDEKLGQDLGDVLKEYNTVLPSEQRATVANIVQDILEHKSEWGSKAIAGDDYQAIRSRMGKYAQKLVQSDPQMSDAYRDIRNALDSAMGRSISKEDFAAWQKVRQQWGAWKTVQKAMAGAGERTAEGYISPSQLRTAVSGRNKGDYARGKGDLAELARAGEGIMKPLPQSGTAPRSFYQSLVTGGGVLAGGIVGPGLAGRALYSRPLQRYLANQVANGPPDTAARRATTRKLLSLTPSLRGLLSDDTNGTPSR